MTELTRRQLRELERRGEPIPVLVSEPDIQVEHFEEQKLTVNLSAPSEIPLTRRQLRELQALQPQQDSTGHEEVAIENREPTADRPLSQSAVSVEITQVRKVEPIQPQERINSLPPIISSRRELRNAQNFTQPAISEELEAVEVLIPEDGFRGSNYLGEPSTQSIMLEIAPEAITLPADTGEIFTTGSITILAESTGSITGALDGVELDSDEAVTGVISVVDPVNARDLIDERSPLGLVPEKVLRRGWWRPWVVGGLSILLAITAILASIAILNALGA